MYHLPETMREELARPLGPVLPGGEAATRASKARFLITVGDATTAAFLEEELTPRVMVVDNKTKRGPFPGPVRERVPQGTAILQAKNPAAGISDAMWEAIATAMSNPGSTLVEVDGEEDLAALPCVLLAPQGAVVAYGQPDQGVVLLTVDDAARDRVRTMLKRMEGA